MVKREFTEVLCCTPSERRGEESERERRVGGEEVTERVKERRIRAGESSEMSAEESEERRERI